MRIEERVAVVEAGHEADREAPFRQRVDEAAPELGEPQRMAQRVDDRARRQALGRHFPQLLDADRVLLRQAVLVEGEAADQRLGQVAAHAVGEDRHRRTDVDARLERGLARAAAVEPLVAGPHAGDPVAVEQHLRAGEAGEDIDARFLHEARQPLDEAVERDDVVAVVAQRRGRDGEPQRPLARQEVDPIFADGGVQRRAALAPVRDQLVEGPADRERRPTACGRRSRAPSPGPRCSAGRRRARAGAWPAGRRQPARRDRRRRSGHRRRGCRVAAHSPSAASAAISAGTTSNRSPTMP